MEAESKKGITFEESVIPVRYLGKILSISIFWLANFLVGRTFNLEVASYYETSQAFEKIRMDPWKFEFSWEFQGVFPPWKTEHLGCSLIYHLERIDGDRLATPKRWISFRGHEKPKTIMGVARLAMDPFHSWESKVPPPKLRLPQEIRR